MSKRVITIQLVSEDPGAVQTAHGFVRQLEPLCDRTSVTVLDEPDWQARQHETLDDGARTAIAVLARNVDVLAGMVAYHEPYPNAAVVLRSMQAEMLQLRRTVSGESE